MIQRFAIVKNEGWFDNDVSPYFYVLERISGWSTVAMSVCAGPFANKIEAEAYVRNVQERIAL